MVSLPHIIRLFLGFRVLGNMDEPLQKDQCFHICREEIAVYTCTAVTDTRPWNSKPLFLICCVMFCCDRYDVTVYMLH